MFSYLALVGIGLLVVYLTARFANSQLSPEAQDEHERLTKSVDEAVAPKRKRGRPRKTTA